MSLINIGRFYIGEADDGTSIRDLCVGDYFYAVGTEAGVSAVWRSVKGITWESISVPNIGTLIGCAAIGENVDRGRLVVVSVNNVYEKDVNGNWTDVTPAGFAGLLFRSIKYLSGTGFCLMWSDGSGTYFRLSTDGVNWTDSTSARPNMNGLIAGTPGFLAFKNSIPRDSIYSSDGGGTWTQYVMNINLALTVWNSAAVKWFVQGGVNIGEFKIYRADFTPAVWTLILDAPGYVTDSAVLIFLNSKLFIINADDTEHGSTGTFNILKSVDGITWETAGDYTKPHTLALQANSGIQAVLRGTHYKPGEFNPKDYYLYTFFDGDDAEAGNNIFDGTDPGPDAPTNGGVADDADPDLGATVTWDDNAVDELAYRIERDDGEVHYVPANTTSWYDSTGKTHSYIVTAVNEDGPSDQLFIQGSGPPQITYIGLLSLAIETFSEFSFMTDIITIVGNITIDIAPLAEMVYLVDPSGVYTLVEGQTHDILYERGGVITTQELKIPDPFFITGYAGD
jgi:hypothetical protein